MARDRKRAKQRRERRGAAALARRDAEDGRPKPPPGQTVRSDLPGSLDHAGAEVDEFDAALIAGAGGVPLAPEEEQQLDETAFGREEDESSPSEDSGAGAPPGGPPSEPPRRPPGGGRGSGDGPVGGGGGELAPEHRNAIATTGGRAVGFLRASWAELQRVQWPDRRQVSQATAVVIGFVAIAGLYLGLADLVAKEIVEFIL
jgi:preprotein translocase SecE subunit